MRRIRLFADCELAKGRITDLPANAAHHLVTVLRAKTGAVITVFNGLGGEFDAELVSAKKGQAMIEVGPFHERNTESPLQITLAQGVAKGDRMDYAIQKATELGVTVIRPLLCERTEVRLDESRWVKKLNHWQAVAISAAEQSGRTAVPYVAAPTKFLDYVESESCARLILDPEGASGGVEVPASKAVVAVGPEGGFTDQERNMAVNAGWQRFNMGPRVLRTETAGVVAISLLQSSFGDLGRI